MTLPKDAPLTLADLERLARLEQQATARVSEAVEFLNEAAKMYDASGVWSMFSGGDDSLTTAIVTSQAVRFRGCLHLDTGTGIPETQQYVIETCRAQGWPLKIYRAKDCGQDYDALALKYGFPGPGAHFRMYIRLKERPLDAFIRDHKLSRADRIVLSTGARSAESQRRMGHVQPLRQDGASVWANPIHNWTKSDCLDVIEASGIHRSPVVELLHMSGECLCGAYAAPNELKEISLWFPSVGARIKALEARVKAIGHRYGWGERRPRKAKRRPVESPLCSQCELEY